MASKSNDIPEEIEDIIARRKPLGEVLEVLKNIKDVWEVKKEASNRIFYKCKLERNLIICSAWYGHAALIDFILTKWKLQHVTDQKHCWNRMVTTIKTLYLPLCVACWHGHEEAASVLISHVLDVNETVLLSDLRKLPYWTRQKTTYPEKLNGIFYASAEDFILCGDQVDLFKAMEGYFLPEQDAVEVDDKRLKLFYKACYFGAEKCVRFLIENTLSTFKNDLTKVRFCIGGNVITPLMVAAQSSAEVCRILVEVGVPLNEIDTCRRNALHYAVLPKSAQSHTGPSPYGRPINGNPPEAVNVTNLFRHLETDKICTIECLNIVKFLVSHGVDRRQTSSFNERVSDDICGMFKLINESRARTVNPLSQFVYWFLNTLARRFRYSSLNRPLYVPSDEKLMEECHCVVEILSALHDPQILIQQHMNEEHPLRIWVMVLRKLLDYLLCEEPPGDRDSALDCQNFSMDYVESIWLSLFSKLVKFIACFLQLFELGYTPQVWDHMDLAYIFKKIVFISQSTHVCYNCNYMPCELDQAFKKMIKKAIPFFKRFLKFILTSNYAIGTRFSSVDYLNQIISAACYRESAVYANEILSLLCSLPHDQYYTFLRTLRNYKRPRFTLPRDPPRFYPIEQSSLSHRIKSLNLDENPRPLAHIARLALYEATNREFTPKILNRLLPSKLLQTYVTEFSFF